MLRAPVGLGAPEAATLPLETPGVCVSKEGHLF